MTIKEQFGFDEGYITIFKGDTYKNKDYFKFETNAHYHPLFKWYIKSTDEVPTDLPEGIESVKLPYEEVFVHDNLLKDEEEIKENISFLLQGEGRGFFIGEVGDFITEDLLVEKVIPYNDGFGKKNYLHIMSNKDNNVFTWATATDKLAAGTTYNISGTIKEHKEYRNEMQNVLTRCAVNEIYLGF